MRRRVYEVLTNPRSDDRVGRIVSIGLLGLIAANVVASVLETDAKLAQDAPGFFKWFELVSVAVFTVEYLLRLWSCTAVPRFSGTIRGRIRYGLSLMALIDLASILPFFLSLLLPGVVDLRFLRVLRLLRLFRLLGGGEQAQGGQEGGRHPWSRQGTGLDRRQAPRRCEDAQEVQAHQEGEAHRDSGRDASRAFRCGPGHDEQSAALTLASSARDEKRRDHRENDHREQRSSGNCAAANAPARWARHSDDCI